MIKLEKILSKCVSNAYVFCYAMGTYSFIGGESVEITVILNLTN